MKPTLPDVFRFAGNARLRLETTLKPLLREAAEKVLMQHALSLTAIEAATIVVRRNEAHYGEIFVEVVGVSSTSNASVVAIRSENGDYSFSLVAVHADKQHNAEANDVMFQVIGRDEIYLSRATEQGPVAFAKLRYAADGTSAAISLFTQALLHRVPSALQSLLPAELKLAALTIVGEKGLCTDDSRPG